ncbi:MAG: hypothetical protein PHY14_03305 [Candidatus Gracilibacteria bacterium]|nr:hypothetical protein [Candidatus Gracilibacteria bacterium]
MIPDTLLIQVAPIRWIGNFSFIDGIYTFMIIVLIFVVFSVLQLFQKQKRKRKIQKEILGVLPILEEKNFEQQAAVLLRKYIQHIYLPHPSQAHTAKDIEEYLSDHEILAILIMLEQAEYRNTRLNKEEQVRVLDCLKELRHKIDV